MESLKDRDCAFIVAVAKDVQRAVVDALTHRDCRKAGGVAHSGDTTFRIDEVAEQALRESLTKQDRRLAYFSEDRGLVKLCPDPLWLLIVDPIDGTRPLMSGFEMGVVSIALCPFSESAAFRDLLAGVVYSIHNQALFYAEKGAGVFVEGFGMSEPQLSTNEDLHAMFWSFDVIGRPVSHAMKYLGDLIQDSGMHAGAFLFHNSAFALMKIVTGHLDAHIDVGGRILYDFPSSEQEFLRIGNGRMMGTFPYDIAAAFVILQETGAVITDAFGASLQDVKLMSSGKQAILSCVAAANAVLHKKIVLKIDQAVDIRIN